ncbi:MAG: hypothetical protein OXC64_01750 [Flavobacteriaceae bacterium]|nr:hypothetical protein [Flavobacteriaceae bacterium]
MFRLTPLMYQHLEKDLRAFHGLFSDGRCQGWEQEELFVRAIRSDTSKSYRVLWQGGGHDDRKDIEIRENGNTYFINIKSGKVEGVRTPSLKISGHRLTRFNGNLEAITEYLNSSTYSVISMSYEKIDDDHGRLHRYDLRYIDGIKFQGLDPNHWQTNYKQDGSSVTSYSQTNEYGVALRISVNMSYQVWWTFPTHILDVDRRFEIR